MPIKSFRIAGVGPLRNAQLDDVPPVVLIAGPNGVGKSTLLECLKKPPQNAVQRTGQVLYISPHRVPFSVRLHRIVPLVGPRSPYRDALAQDFFSFGSSLSDVSVSLGHPWHGLFNLSGMQRTRLAPDPAPYFQMKYKLAQFKQEFDAKLSRVFERHGGEVPRGTIPEDIYRPFRELATRLLPGVAFSHVALENDEYKVYFRNRLGVQVEFDSLSSGEKDALAMMFPFVEKQIEAILAEGEDRKGDHEDLVVLIDSPEAYLHPTLQKRLLEYMRDSVRDAERRGESLQFIVATHSTSMINWGEPGELFLLLFPDQAVDGNQIVQITGDQDKLRAIKELLGDAGLAFLVTGKPCLLLEGDTDPEILRILMGPWLDSQFVLIPVGGKGKILSLIKTFGDLLGELQARGLRVCGIVDRDAGEEISNEFCLTWPRPALENFLLEDSEAIYEALGVLIGYDDLARKGVSSPQDIDRLLAGIAGDPWVIEEAFRNRIGERMKLYVPTAAGNLEEIRAAMQEVLERKLARLNQDFEELKSASEALASDPVRAIRELDGKAILARMAREFGVKRSLLARSIADKLRQFGRVPPEITEVITQIRQKCGIG